MGLGKVTLVSALLVAVSSVAVTQAKPENPAVPEDAQISSPRWGSGSNYTPNGDNPMAGVDNLVTQTVLGVPQAKADAVVAKWTYRKINSDLNLASTFMQKDFRESDEYDQAFTEFQTAYDELEAVRAKALAGLRDDARYQAALSMRQNVSEQIADEHEQKDPDAERLISLAGLKVDSIASFRDMERDTLTADQNVVAAREKLIAAGKKLAKIERDFASKVRNDGALAELRQSRADARIAMLAASTYRVEMRVARYIALRYAYAARGYDRYVPRLSTYDYGYGSYGYGYGYPAFGYPVFTGHHRYSTTSAPFHNNTAGGIIR